MIRRLINPTTFFLTLASKGRRGRHVGTTCLLATAFIFLFCSVQIFTGRAQSSYFDTSPELDEFVNGAGGLVSQTVKAFPGVLLNQLAVTLVDMQQERPTAGHHRGDANTYPASVVKIFFEGMGYHQIDDEQRMITAEFHRASVDMIRDSNNDATAYIVDLITDTTSGPELPPNELDTWIFKRRAVNRYFQSLNYPTINANQKPWSFGPYGRELQSVRTAGRNALTTIATARLFHEIATGRFINAEASAKLLGLLKRELPPTGCPPNPPNPDGQTCGFIGNPLPAGSLLWSKAGWTSRDRHDAALVTLPSGQSYILVIFTSGHAFQRDIIRFMSRVVMEHMQDHGARPRQNKSWDNSGTKSRFELEVGSGVKLGGPARYWSPATACGSHTYNTTTPTSFPEASLNHALIPAPKEAIGHRVQVRVWIPTCDGNAKVSYRIHTNGTDSPPYVIDQQPYDDVYVNVGPPTTIIGEDSYLYFTDYAPQSGTMALSDVDWQVLEAGGMPPETF